MLRDLQQSKVDGAEFIRLRRQIEELRPLCHRLEGLGKDLKAHEAHRRNLISEWEDIKAREYREIADAAAKISKTLRERVKVEVTMAGSREPLDRVLREIEGNLAVALERLRATDQLSLPELAQRCREGKEALIESYGPAPWRGGTDRWRRHRPAHED